MFRGAPIPSPDGNLPGGGGSPVRARHHPASSLEPGVKISARFHSSSQPSH